MKIKILSVGKTKKGYISQGIQEYLKRLRCYTSMEWVDLPSLRRSKVSLCEESLRQEAQRIRTRLHPQGLVVALTDDGKEFSSEDFAGWLERQMIRGIHEIDFIIGSDLGLDPSIISDADLCLSLSRMTFTHQMVRLVLLEQIYRAFTIIRGEPYHHG